MNHVALAANTAFLQHYGQMRADKKTPFYNHLVEVTGFMMEHGVHNPTWLAAAYLHDVVEDTDYTLADVENNFGKEVRLLVAEVTDPAEFVGVEAKNRQMRLAKSGFYSLASTIIKVADKRANTLDTLNAPWALPKKLEYIESSLQIVKFAAGWWEEHDIVKSMRDQMLADVKPAIHHLIQDEEPVHLALQNIVGLIEVSP